MRGVLTEKEKHSTEVALDSIETQKKLPPKLPSGTDGLLGSLALPMGVWGILILIKTAPTQWLAEHMRWTQFLYLIPYMWYAHKLSRRRALIGATIGMIVVLIFGQDYVHFLLELFRDFH